MTITREKLFRLVGLLKALKTEKNKKFQYMCLKNIPLIEKEIELFQEIVKFERKDEYDVYESERIEMVKKFANKDETGEFIIKNNNYDISEENVIKFNAEYVLLNEKFKDLIKAVDDNNAKANELLKEEINIELYTIDFDNIPDKVDAEELEFLMLISK